MDWMYLVYFLLGGVLFAGARFCRRGKWNEDYTSLGQTKVLLGFTALCIALHHLGQKSCGPWHPRSFIVHGLDFFVPLGYLFVAVFLFCSGMGLYKSLKTKPNYLRGFVKRRIMPIVIAYYLSSVLYLIARAGMGEKMDSLTMLWYLSGLHMSNNSAWYIVVIPFFYLVFYLAFRFCRREGAAIGLVFLFTLIYTALSAFVDHQDDWWICGEWWYNSIIMFPLGLLFARHERAVTAAFKKGYWLWLALAVAGMIASYRFADLAANSLWGYYGETFNDPLKVVHRLGSAASQWLVCVFYTALCFLIMLKARFGNAVLVWLGGVTLEFYLVHTLFVEMFGFNFMEVAKSVVYIRNVPLFILAVLACSVPATLLFRFLWKCLCRLLLRNRRRAAEPEAEV